MKTCEVIELLEKDFSLHIKKYKWKHVVRLIEKANESYYNSGETIMTDYLYDMLKDHLLKIFPSHRLNKTVGAPIIKDKVKLPYWMGSMDKIKPESKKLDKWSALTFCGICIF